MKLQIRIIVGYNGGFCEKKNKVKEELAHGNYNRKTVVIGIKVCITNDADKNVGLGETTVIATYLHCLVVLTGSKYT